MIPSLEFLLIVIPILLIVQGGFSGSELALISADAITLRARAVSGSWPYRLAAWLKRNPERIFSSTLLVTSSCVVLLSTLVTLYFISADPHKGEIYAVLFLSPLIVFVGELFPKAYFQRNSDRLVPYCAVLVTVVYFLFFPITRLLTFYTATVSRFFRVFRNPYHQYKADARTEILSLLRYGVDQSESPDSESSMIRRIIELKGKVAKSVMIPLIHVEAISESSTVKEAIERFKFHRHSRMPVFSGRVDQVVGVLEVSDLFNAHGPEQSIRSFWNEPLFVAEMHALEDLIARMFIQNAHLAVVVDEYGGASGLITFEDVIEEIVGEIADEHDELSVQVQEQSPNTWLIQGSHSMQDLRDYLKIDLPSGDFETFGGFLLSLFKRIPEPGAQTQFQVDEEVFVVTVRKANRKQILSAHLERRVS